MKKSQTQEPQEVDAESLISPKRAASMLDVSRSQIDRLAAQFGWTRVYLSNQKRGSVRYRRAQIIDHIKVRSV